MCVFFKNKNKNFGDIVYNIYIYIFHDHVQVGAYAKRREKKRIMSREGNQHKDLLFVSYIRNIIIQQYFIISLLLSLLIYMLTLAPCDFDHRHSVRENNNKIIIIIL